MHCPTAVVILSSNVSTQTLDVMCGVLEERFHGCLAFLVTKGRPPASL
jgi:hypothetical protein